MIPDKILDEVISDIAGDDVVKLVQFIKEKSHISEFNIAEKLNMTVNHVRNMLYRLEVHNLVDFVRKKDKKKGWYVYFWTLDMVRLRDLAVHMKRQMVLKLKGRIIKEEQGEFFNCPEKHIRVNLENAMEYHFKCPECGFSLQHENNEKLLTNIRKQIDTLTEDISLLESLDIKPPEKKLIHVIKQKKKVITQKKKIVRKKVKRIKKKFLKKKAIKKNIKMRKRFVHKKK